MCSSSMVARSGLKGSGTILGFLLKVFYVNNIIQELHSLYASYSVFEGVSLINALVASESVNTSSSESDYLLFVGEITSEPVRFRFS